MKTKFFIISLIALISGSCSSSKIASNQNFQDDVYYNPSTTRTVTTVVAPASGVSQVAANSYTAVSPSDMVGMSDYERYRLALESGQSVEEATASVRSAPVEYYDAPESENYGHIQYAYVETTQAQDKQGNTYITNNFYDDSYSARINRFSGPYLGFSYFDPWYYGPSYRFGYSSYYGWNMSFGWGYPYYSPWYYDPWYYRPYYGYYDPWYHRPYYGGGCWSCYNNYYRPDYYYPSNRTRVSGPVYRRSSGSAYASTRYATPTRSSAGVSPRSTTSSAAYSSSGRSAYSSSSTQAKTPRRCSPSPTAPSISSRRAPTTNTHSICKCRTTRCTRI